jgi:hypothetical protein
LEAPPFLCACSTLQTKIRGKPGEIAQPINAMRELQQQLILRCTLIAVPVSTIFGLAAATAIARRQFSGKALPLSVNDRPISISPVVVGLMLVLDSHPAFSVPGRGLRPDPDAAIVRRRRLQAVRHRNSPMAPPSCWGAWVWCRCC